MPTVEAREPYAEITLQNGEKFKVTETFSTVMRHQKEALDNDLPLMDLMGPDGVRIAADPIEIISVIELRRPTRNYANGNGNQAQDKPKAKAKPKNGRRKKAEAKTPAQTRFAQRKTRGRTRRRVTAA